MGAPVRSSAGQGGGGLLGFLTGPHLVGAGGAVGHILPRRRGAQAALAHVVERRRLGVGTGVCRPGAVEFELGGHAVNPFFASPGT